jgi:hypothetical protein
MPITSLECWWRFCRPEANRSRQTPHYGSEQRLEGTPTSSSSRQRRWWLFSEKFVVIKKPARITGSSNTAPANHWKRMRLCYHYYHIIKASKPLKVQPCRIYRLAYQSQNAPKRSATKSMMPVKLLDLLHQKSSKSMRVVWFSEVFWPTVSASPGTPIQTAGIVAAIIAESS